MSILKPIESDSDQEESSKHSGKTNSSKLFVLIGVILLAIIGGNFVMNQVQRGALSMNFNPVSVLGSKSKAPEINTDSLIKEAQHRSSLLGQEAVKLGQGIGAAVLGETVKVVEKTASQSASTAASLVIKTTVPALVDQINKLPDPQKKEIQKIICE